VNHQIDNNKLSYLKNTINKLGDPKIVSVKRVMSGQVNEVYNINDKFIVRFSDGHQDGRTFLKEYKIYKAINGKVNIPQVIFTDFSHKNIYLDVIACLNIKESKTLAEKWISISLKDKEEYIKKICKELKKLHSLKLNDFKFLDLKPGSWPIQYGKYIEDCIKSAEKDKEIDTEVVHYLKEYYEWNKQFLKSNSALCRLVHGDIHFENILVSNRNILLFDFEYSNIAPIDFELAKIINFCLIPEKFVEKKLESHYKNKNCLEVLILIKKFYPELFSIKNPVERQKLFLIPDILWGFKWAYLPKVKSKNIDTKKVKKEVFLKQIKIAKRRYREIFQNNILEKFFQI
jgi:thiamine kinase-like enzyme